MAERTAEPTTWTLARPNRKTKGYPKTFRLNVALGDKERALLNQVGYEEAVPHSRADIENVSHPDVSLALRGKLMNLATSGAAKRALQEEGFDVVETGEFDFDIRRPGERGFKKFDPLGMGSNWSVSELFKDLTLDLGGDYVDHLGGMAGAKAGGAAGALGGPLAPVTVPLGAIAGYGLGTFGSGAARTKLGGNLAGTPAPIGEALGESAVRGAAGAAGMGLFGNVLGRGAVQRAQQRLATKNILGKDKDMIGPFQEEFSPAGWIAKKAIAPAKAVGQKARERGWFIPTPEEVTEAEALTLKRIAELSGHDKHDMIRIISKYIEDENPYAHLKVKSFNEAGDIVEDVFQSASGGNPKLGGDPESVFRAIHTPTTDVLGDQNLISPALDPQTKLFLEDVHEVYRTAMRFAKTAGKDNERSGWDKLERRYMEFLHQRKMTPWEAKDAVSKSTDESLRKLRGAIDEPLDDGLEEGLRETLGKKRMGFARREGVSPFERVGRPGKSKKRKIWDSGGDFRLHGNDLSASELKVNMLNWMQRNIAPTERLHGGGKRKGIKLSKIDAKGRKKEGSKSVSYGRPNPRDSGGELRPGETWGGHASKQVKDILGIKYADDESGEKLFEEVLASIDHLGIMKMREKFGQSGRLMMSPEELKAAPWSLHPLRKAATVAGKAGEAPLNWLTKQMGFLGVDKVIPTRTGRYLGGVIGRITGMGQEGVNELATNLGRSTAFLSTSLIGGSVVGGMGTAAGGLIAATAIGKILSAAARVKLRDVLGWARGVLADKSVKAGNKHPRLKQYALMVQKAAREKGPDHARAMLYIAMTSNDQVRRDIEELAGTDKE